MIVLGIETSCDETAASVVRLDADGPIVLSDVVRSQLDDHAAYGGVVPEIAARAHLDMLPDLVDRALDEARVSIGALDAAAATTGPGLIGGLLVGSMTAKGIAWAAGKPFIAVNHLEAHALMARLIDRVAFPYLLLLVSGGHTQLLVCNGVGDYRQLGTTLDDAAGEAFDKTAKLIGLGYPGGSAIEHAARDGDARRFTLPRPLKGRPGCDFSFSGLKTAVRHIVGELTSSGPLGDRDKADLAAGVQQAIAEAVCDRVGHAIRWFRDHCSEGDTLVASGGVVANGLLRAGLTARAVAGGLRFVAPPPPQCTDNGAMIAWAGIERLRLGLVDGFDAPARPRWPLDGSVAARGGGRPQVAVAVSR